MRLASLSALLWLGLSSGCFAPAWKESSPDGTFKVLTPTPLVEENPQDKSPGETVYSSSEKYGKYMIYISEAAEIKDETIIQESLKSIANSLAEKAQAKLRYLHPFMLQGKYHGVDLEADRLEQRSAIRIQIIYARNRVYRLIVSGDRSWLTIAEVSKFLKSFEILE